MTVTAERFAQGLTYEEYKAQMTRNRERFEANEQALKIDPAVLATFKNLERPLHVVVLAEDWCGDVIANLPVLGGIAQQSDKLQVRVFLRDQNHDLMNQYLNQGKYMSIPVFAFFDEEFNPLEHLIERPASVTTVMDRKRQEIFANNPDFGAPGTPPAELPEEVRGRLMQAFAALREEMREFSDDEMAREFQAIAQKAAR